MKNRNATKHRLLGLALLAAITVPVSAQAPAEQKMTAEQKAQMDAFVKAMTPGKQHQQLAANVGTWDGSVSVWEAPGKPPQVSQTHSERTMALGGRVLQAHWTGSMMGMPFEGMGTTGYDNASGKWWSTWTDTMTTGTLNSSGTCDADPKRGCVYTATMVDPATGKEAKNRTTLSWATPDEEKLEMFAAGPDGKEFKVMEISTHRVKK
ncbi:MAG: DUF1579 family protein [Thermoanaerobaculia bacterium]